MYGKQIEAQQAVGIPSALERQGIAGQYQKSPRKFMSDQMQQIGDGLDCLFGHIDNLERRLAPVSDPINCANGCSPEQLSSDPSYVIKLDQVIERIEIARQLIVSIEDRLRV